MVDRQQKRQRTVVRNISSDLLKTYFKVESIEVLKNVLDLKVSCVTIHQRLLSQLDQFSGWENSPLEPHRSLDVIGLDTINIKRSYYYLHIIDFPFNHSLPDFNKQLPKESKSSF